MTIVQITTDGREPFREYNKTQPWFGAAPEALLQGFSQLPEVSIHVVSCTQRPMVASPRKLANNIWFHSLHVPKLGWMRTGFQGCVRSVRRKLRELQPDIVHGQGTERECALSAVFSGFRNVLTMHGNARSIARINRALPLSYWWLAARLESLALSRTQGVFCNSLFTKSEVKSTVPRTWLVPNALRLPFFDLPRAPSVESLPILLNIGVIQQRKQQLELLHEAIKWRKLGCAFKLRFIGVLDKNSSYAEAFGEEIIKLQKEGWVEHVYKMDCQQIISALDQSAALIHVPKEEAFGLVVAEAIARGCRVFGFDIGGMSEICRGTKSEGLIKFGNWKELGKQILEWLNQKFGRDEAGAMEMRSRYHPAVVAQKHLEIYRELTRTRL